MNTASYNPPVKTRNTHGGVSIGYPVQRVSLIKRQSGTHVVKFRNIDRASREYGRVYRQYRALLSEARSLATAVKAHPNFELMGAFTI